MTYIPNHIEIRQNNISKNLHNILFDYFSFEIETLERYHSTWLKYPIIEIKNMFFITCKENDKKIKSLCEDFSNFEFIDKKFVNKLNKKDGVIYKFKAI